MYQSQIGAQVDWVHEIAQDLGMGKQYMIDGSMKFGASVPGYASWILSADYTSKMDGRDLEFSAHNLLLGFEAFSASGSVSLDTFNITSRAGDTYFLMKDLKENNMLSPLMSGVFQKYNNTWLALTRAYVEESFSGKSMFSYNFSEWLSSLTSDELKNLLVKYPVFQQTEDLGMSGSFHAYTVMLNAPNIVSLVDALSTRLTGSGLAADERESFSKELSSLASSGMVLYDPKNPKYISLSMNLVAKEGGEAQIILHEDRGQFSLSISSWVSAFSLSSDTSENGEQSIHISITKERKEVAKMIAIIKHDAGRFSELDLTIASPAQGVTLTLTHKNAQDGSFAGNMNFWLGNATWTGAVLHDALASLHLHGAAVGTTLSLDLDTKNGDMMQGPVILRSGNTEMFTADLGLRATPERFFLSLLA